MLTRSKSLLNNKVIKDVDLIAAPIASAQGYALEMRKYFISEAAKLRETPTNSVDMKRYMRNQFDFIGLKQPKRKEILKKFIAAKGTPKDENDLLNIFRLPEREFTYCAMELAALNCKKEKPPPSRISMYIAFGLHQPWWDTIDVISSKLVGEHLQQYPELIDTYVGQWLAHESIWIKRISILFQLRYKKNTDLDLLFKCIDTTYMEHKDEFFIQKAIGWALREYAKTDKKAVEDFINSRPNLSKLSKREATKYF